MDSTLHPAFAPDHAAPESPGRLLITAGPTHEPIDAVRYIGNRSSGRLGIALAEESVRRGWSCVLLLGPTPRAPADTRVRVHRFRTTADLESLLLEHQPRADVLVMAAAVADFRPSAADTALSGKRRRTGEGLTLHLEATPDLLAGCAARRRPGQLLVGFALEPREDLVASARAKLERKSVDLVVGNPLETMDSDLIEAVVVARDGSERRTPGGEGRSLDKGEFAGWLLGIIESARGAGRSTP